VLRKLTLYFVNLLLPILLIFTISGCGNKAIDEQEENILTKSEKVETETEKERLRALGERLMSSVSNEDNIIVKSNLQNGADPNFKSITGKTPLTLAAKYGYERIVRLLIKKGADVNLKDTQGQYPITEAAKNNHRNIVNLLIANNSNIDFKDKDNNTALAIAIKTNSLALAKDLIIQGANIYNLDRARRSALLIARREAANSIIPLLKDVSLLKRNGLTSNHLSQIIVGNRQETFAFIKKHISIPEAFKLQNFIFQAVTLNNDFAKFYFLDELTKLQFNLNGEVGGRNVPLHYAVIKQDFDTVITLLENSANPNQLNDENKTPLVYAVRNLKPNLVKLLQEYKAERFFKVEPNYKVDSCSFFPFKRLKNYSIVKNI
jgi:ankyrin repeat protein